MSDKLFRQPFECLFCSNHRATCYLDKYIDWLTDRFSFFPPIIILQFVVLCDWLSWLSFILAEYSVSHRIVLRRRLLTGHNSDSAEVSWTRTTQLKTVAHRGNQSRRIVVSVTWREPSWQAPISRRSFRQTAQKPRPRLRHTGGSEGSRL